MRQTGSLVWLELPEAVRPCASNRREMPERCRARWTMTGVLRFDESSPLTSLNRADCSPTLRVFTMMTSRFTRTLIMATCTAALASGCCVTSMKFRHSQQAAPCQTPYESEPLPLPIGTPPTYETPPSPLPSPSPPPAPASASTLEDLGVKTSAMFRSMGNKMKHALDRS